MFDILSLLRYQLQSIVNLLLKHEENLYVWYEQGEVHLKYSYFQCLSEKYSLVLPVRMTKGVSDNL